MMNTQEIQKLHTAIVECIDQQRLNQAMSLLAKLTDETGSAQLRDQLEQVKMSYNFMLQYMSQGVLDPKRDEVLGHIVSTLWTLTDQCVIMLREKDSPEVFFARRRELADVALSDLMTQYRTLLNKSRLLLTVDEDKRDRAALLEVLRSREQCETTIFNKIWSAFPTTKGEAEIIGQFITDEDIPEPARCLAVMALLLGLTKYYDETKLSLLADAYSIVFNDVIGVEYNESFI